jgi:hypothetical protein
MDWKTLLGTIVIALLSSAVLTSILNNMFLLRREERGRKREARGMLQRARSSAAMFLEVVKAKEYDSDITINSRLSTLRDMMLSLEFTTATADLDLDEAYRALETLQIEARGLVLNSNELKRLSQDDGAWPALPDGDENPEFDPEIAERRETHREHQTLLVNAVSKQAERVVSTIASQQKRLRRSFLGDLQKAFPLPKPPSG